MFQPQPTPYSFFSSYGGAIPDFVAFPPVNQSSSASSTLFRSATALNPAPAEQQRVQQQHNPQHPAYNNLILPPHNHGSNNNNPESHLSQNFKMASADDLAAQEALARDFQPSLEGPLVGSKKSSQVITQEYAKADPIYVAKTAALPQKYSHFRPVLGDGNCGWRAAGFSYFETLIAFQNRIKIDGELARMISLNNYLTRVGGFQSWMFEDMVDETINLLKDLADVIDGPPGAAEVLLFERFNNSEVSNAIIYHFRLLASSWLKGNAGTYEAFIQDDDGVEGYSKSWLEPPNQEIEHLGMTLLVDVLLKPAGIAVEVVYLDRSEGTHVNTHIMQAQDENGIPIHPDAPMIHLLYRPSHYDILYKHQDSLQHAINEAVLDPNVQVNRATFAHSRGVQRAAAPINQFNLDLSTLLSIPGFDLSPSSQNGFTTPFSPIGQSYVASPICSSISSTSLAPSANMKTPALGTIQFARPQHPQPRIQSQQAVISPSLPSPRATFPPANMAIPIHTQPHDLTTTAIPTYVSEHASPTSPSSFRPSKYEWAAAAGWKEGPLPTFQTSTFKNSHYNTAHYNNPNFQPEEWTPENEDGTYAPRKRST